MLALRRAGQLAEPGVNLAAAGTAAVMGGLLAYGALAAGSETALVGGIAPTGEYTNAVRALDALGKTNPGAKLTPAQARALAQNVLDVLRVTAAAAATRGGPYVESLRAQLALPRFAFLDQIPGPLKEEIVNAAAKVGITVK